MFGGRGEESILIIFDFSAGVLGTSCLPSLSRKAKTAKWSQQHKAAATQKTNLAFSVDARTSWEKAKPFLGVKEQMQNKQLEMRLESKRKKETPSPSLTCVLLILGCLKIQKSIHLIKWYSPGNSHFNQVLFSSFCCYWSVITNLCHLT